MNSSDKKIINQLLKVLNGSKINLDISSDPEEKEYEDLVVGRNPVLELLKSNKDINSEVYACFSSWGSQTDERILTIIRS